MKTRIMEIVIVRHGPAVNIGTQGVKTDEQRMLSEGGRAHTAAVARGLRTLGCTPELILTSPLRRARETAEIIADGLGGLAEVADCDALAPEGEATDAVHAIAARTCATVIVVGHMPNVSELVSALLSGGDDLDIPFRKAQACSVLCEGVIVPRGGALNWFLPPGVLCALGGVER